MLSDLVEKVIEPGIGVMLEDYILIVVLCAFLIFYAMDFRLGLLLQLVGLSALYLGFYAIGFYTGHILLIIMATVAMLAISLFISGQKTRSGYS